MSAIARLLLIQPASLSSMLWMSMCIFGFKFEAIATSDLQPLHPRAAQKIWAAIRIFI